MRRGRRSRRRRKKRRRRGRPGRNVWFNESWQSCVHGRGKRRNVWLMSRAACVHDRARAGAASVFTIRVSDISTRHRVRPSLEVQLSRRHACNIMMKVLIIFSNGMICLQCIYLAFVLLVVYLSLYIFLLSSLSVLEAQPEFSCFSQHTYTDFLGSPFYNKHDRGTYRPSPEVQLSRRHACDILIKVLISFQQCYDLSSVHLQLLFYWWCMTEYAAHFVRPMKYSSPGGTLAT